MRLSDWAMARGPEGSGAGGGTSTGGTGAGLGTDTGGGMGGTGDLGSGGSGGTGSGGMTAPGGVGGLGVAGTPAAEDAGLGDAERSGGSESHSGASQGEAGG